MPQQQNRLERKDIMTRRVFIVHGFEGNPHGNWFDWLAAQARACGGQAGA